MSARYEHYVQVVSGCSVDHQNASGSASTSTALSTVHGLRDFPSRGTRSTHNQASTRKVGSLNPNKIENNDAVEKEAFSLFGKNNLVDSYWL